MNLADTGSGFRSDSNQADEAFRRSLDSLSRLLASRSAAPPPPLPETERFAARNEATAFRSRRSATAALLLVAATATVGAGVYAFLQGAVPPHPNHRIETVAASVAPPAVARPLPSIATIAPLPVDAVPVSPADFPQPKPVLNQPLDTRAISELQTRLRRLGFSPGAIDGVTGPMTVAAIKRYQQSKGHAPTGNVDDELLDQLSKEPSR